MSSNPTDRSTGAAVAADDDATAHLLASAVDLLDEPVVVTRMAAGGERCVEYANPAFAGLAGRDGTDLRGQDLADVLGGLLEGDREVALDGALEARTPVLLGALRTPGRRGRRAFEIRGYAIDDGAATPAAVFVLDDVSTETRERTMSDREQRRLARLVDQRTERLEQLHEHLRLTERLASIGTLAAGLCHDMNNLLMPIRGHLDSVESGPLSAGQKRDIAATRVAVDFLQRLANGLRLFALDPDDAEASPATTEVAKWWNQLEPLLRGTIPAHVAFEVDIPDDLPMVGVAAHRLTQAVLNLLINSGDAVGADGRIRLWAGTTDDARFVKLGVTDNGKGMSREAQQHALDPFFTTKKRGQSTGLGLSLVHGIVHSAGGRVEIESAVRRGTTITLSLPGLPEAIPPAPASPAEAAPPALVTLEDPRLAACFATLLRSAGFALVTADDAAPGPLALLVCDTATPALDRARDVLAGSPGCKLIAYGRGSADWKEIGASVIERTDGLKGIREAVRRLVLTAEEQR